MLGTALGDLYGSAVQGGASAYRHLPAAPANRRFSDDTVCMLAVVDHLLHSRDLVTAIKEWVSLYPEAGYEHAFLAWAQGKLPQPVSSWGNSALTRVAPVVLLSTDLEAALSTAQGIVSATSTQSIPLAQVAVANYIRLLWLALNGATRDEVLAAWENLGGELHPVEALRAEGSPVRHRADETLEDALSCLAESHDFESLMGTCLYHGGDTSTLAAVAGALGELLWGVPLDHVAVLRATCDVRTLIMLEALYDTAAGD